MADTTIKVENVSKMYKLGEFGTGTLAHDLNRWWAGVRGKEDPLATVGKVNDRRAGGTDDYVWALHDINFEAERGEILGIIGRNGAGKSTLLKLLSKVTGPTEGTIKLNGRTGSLLEVGTGMHPEMTAKENIYLNGAILGMTKNEIASKFDDIVDFAGVAKYVDTPIKRFSSGMKVRLGFAVAAFLEPEILIVDEVLAVGDLAFQQKCIEKMDDVSKGGRTILFVSHNMAAVEGLCTRCMLLENGKVTYNNGVEKTIDKYRERSLNRNTGQKLSKRTDRDGVGDFLFTNVSVNDGGQIRTLKPLKIDLHYRAKKSFQTIQVAVKFSRNYREVIMTIDSEVQGKLVNIDSGKGTITIQVPFINLMPNTYFIDLWAGVGSVVEDRIFNAAQLTVEETDIYNSGNALIPQKHGVAVVPKCEWSNTQK